MSHLSTARVLVCATYVGIVAIALLVGAINMIASFSLCLFALPFLLMFVLPLYSSTFNIPMWIYVSGVYIVELLWLASIWLTGTRAWDRNSTKSGVAFVILVAIAIGIIFLLAQNVRGL